MEISLEKIKEGLNRGGPLIKRMKSLGNDELELVVKVPKTDDFEYLVLDEAAFLAFLQDMEYCHRHKEMHMYECGPCAKEMRLVREAL